MFPTLKEAECLTNRLPFEEKASVELYPYVSDVFSPALDATAQARKVQYIEPQGGSLYGLLIVLVKLNPTFLYNLLILKVAIPYRRLLRICMAIMIAVWDSNFVKLIKQHTRIMMPVRV